jgi:hypothetical protein
VAKANAFLSWLPMYVVVRRVAHRFGCTLVCARSQIVREAEAGRIRACGLTDEGWPRSLLPAAWRDPGADGYAVDLCFDDVIAAHLLPAQPARVPVDVALAMFIEGMPLERKEWPPETEPHRERAVTFLGDEHRARRVSVWGKRSLAGLGQPGHWESIEEQIPRSEDYRSPDWSSRGVDLASLRQAAIKPLRPERWMLHDAEQLYAECGSESAARAAESMPPEPVPPVEPPADHPAESAKPAAAPHPGGRRPVVDWKMVREEVFRLMDYHGEFSDNDPEWNAQARLEEAIADFCENKLKRHVGGTAIRENIRESLERWRQSRPGT